MEKYQIIAAWEYFCKNEKIGERWLCLSNNWLCGILTQCHLRHDSLKSVTVSKLILHYWSISVTKLFHTS